VVESTRENVRQGGLGGGGCGLGGGSWGRGGGWAGGVKTPFCGGMVD